MNLAFYYHISVRIESSNRLFLPSYLGVFVDSLASNLEHLYLVLHQSPDNDEEADYLLKAKNITLLNLGLKTPAWHRLLNHRKILKDKLSKINNCNILLVRSPSPLAPYFKKYLDKTKLVYMIVGDYGEGVKNMPVRSLRELVIKYYLRYNNWLFEKEIYKSDIVVNSSLLFKKYQSTAKSIKEIRTTTLSNNDFYLRKDTCLAQTIQLLYTGRIEFQKGLVELIEATSLLLKNGNQVCLNIVGWESDSKEPIKHELIQLAKKKGMMDNLAFHGRKKVGSELNEMYRMADIYVIPSYHEGFPRTIWEAMANSLPVVATNVGAIPDFLKNNHHALIVNPKNIEDLYQAIKQVILNKELRQKLIYEGQLLAKENTLEFQTKKLFNILENVATI